MENIKIAIDAMGADNKVVVEVTAAVNIVKKLSNVELYLYGDESEINKYLTSHERIHVIHCETEIDINQEPVIQVRKKKDSSMVMALNAVKSGECHAIVSAGSTGALIAGGLLIVGRIKGVKRPALSPILPAVDGVLKVMLDIGANDEVKEEYLLQNAKMGIEFIKALGINDPKVVLLNIGSEAKKGTAIYQNTYQKLVKDSQINFQGNIEGRDILTTSANVIVTDGFSGNIALKTIEGTAMVVAKMFKDVLKSNTKNKLAALVVKNDLSKAAKVFDYHEVGGSILLGCKGVIVKAHGSSTEYSFEKAIELAYDLESKSIVKKIAEVI